jgi:hypothetical protein
MDAFFFLTIDILNGYKGEYRQENSHRCDQYPGRHTFPELRIFYFVKHDEWL